MDLANFSGKEIIDMALRIEENGIDYYTQACSTTKSNEIKELFLFLAKEEKKHISIFKDIGKNVKDDNLPGIFDTNLEDEPLYLKALADARVFANKDEINHFTDKILSEEEVLTTAINMEKDSILFYYELHNAIRDKDKPILISLINEEKIHLQKLTEMKRNLT